MHLAVNQAGFALRGFKSLPQQILPALPSHLTSAHSPPVGGAWERGFFMKKFWEKIQESLAKQIVTGLAAGFSILAYKIIPPNVRQSLLQKLNELFDLIPPTVYLLVLIIVAGVLGWVVWRLSRKNRILEQQLRTLTDKSRTVRGPADFVDVGHEKILIRVTYPAGLDVTARPEEISTTPFCKEHKTELQDLPHEFSAFGAKGDYVCHACGDGVKFKGSDVEKLNALARSQFVRTRKSQKSNSEILKNLD